MKQELAKVLSDLVGKKGIPQAQIARELGYTRQRFNQLIKASHDASCEAIEKAINQMGYKIQTVTVSKAEHVH